MIGVASTQNRSLIQLMDVLVETLDTRLRQWKPETAAEVRKRVAEIIELADQEVLDLQAFALGGTGRSGHSG
jgi:hypothetical protein